MSPDQIFHLIGKLNALRCTFSNESLEKSDSVLLIGELIDILCKIGQDVRVADWTRLAHIKNELGNVGLSDFQEELADLESQLNFTVFPELSKKACASFSEGWAASRWLTSPNPKFDFRTPLQVYRSGESGQFEVLNELQAIRLGVPSAR